jgi:hypothetical protein
MCCVLPLGLNWRQAVRSSHRDQRLIRVLHLKKFRVTQS